MAGCPITPRSPQPTSSRLMMMKFGFCFAEEEEVEVEHGRNCRRNMLEIIIIKFSGLVMARQQT